MGICCFLSPRTGAILIGFINIFVGLGSISTIGYILYENRTNEKSLFWDLPEPRNDSLNQEFWILIHTYAFPTLASVLLGILIIVSVIKKSAIIGTIAFILSLLLILGSLAIFLILFVLGAHWFLLLPLLPWTGCQIYFLIAYQQFRRTGLKRQTI